MKRRTRSGVTNLSLANVPSLRIFKTACLTLVIATAGLLGAGPARGVTVIYDFDNGSSDLDGNGGVGDSWMVDSLTLTTENVQGPVYVDNGMGGLVWDGTTRAAATTNIPSGNYLAVNSANPQPAAGDPERWEVGELWTFSFDLPVIVRQINLTSFSAANDNLTVAIAPDNFVFVGNVNGSTLTDPFGPSYEIPAGTNITFEHAGSPDNGANWWGLSELHVEIVPEPSAFGLAVMIAICLSLYCMRQVST